MPISDEAIVINSGTCLHTEQDAGLVNFNGFSFRPKYIDSAYVARRDWRGLTAAERRILRAPAHGGGNDHNTVYVGAIPEALKECLLQTGVSDARNEEEVLARFRGDEDRTKKLSAALSGFLTPLAGNKPFHFHCIGTNFPNVEMLSFDLSRLPKGYRPEEVRHLGMHNDGKSSMSVYTAHKFGNRISINLGKDSRYFLFINLSLIQAMNLLKKKIDVVREGVDFTNIRAFFFKHFPDYPVIRIRQDPYRYYIAPTYNFFHDGSTLGNTQLDITIIYFGNFQC